MNCDLKCLRIERAPVAVGLPPIAPPLRNAIFALTRKQVRRLPGVRGGQFTI
jgi:hypothetical protein